MPAPWDTSRWVQLDDGSYRRRAVDDVDEVAYSSMKKVELVEELEYRGLSKTGNKDELIARLEADDIG